MTALEVSVGFVKNRLGEDNTYIGLAFLASTFFDFNLTEAQLNAITFFGMAMVAAPEGNLKRVLGKLQQSKLAKSGK